MSRALALRENQVRAIIRAARKESVRVEVRLGDAIITVIPNDNSRDHSEHDRGEEIEL